VPTPTHRRALGRIALAAALAAGLVAFVASLPADAAELLSNGGFESGLSGWSCSGSTGQAVTTPVHSGSRALAGAATSSDNAQCTQTVNVVSGTSYTLSDWVRGNYVYLGVTGGASTWTPSATDWTELRVTFTATSSTVQVFLHGWYAQGTYLADDVSLSGVGGSPPTTGAPSPSPTRTTPPPSPSSPPPSSPPPGNGSFRAPIYVMPLDNNPQNITSAMSASGARAFNLAFVLDSGGCTPAWNGDPAHRVATDTTVAGVITAVRGAGGDVAVSFGGYNGTELGATCGGASGLAAAYQAVINRYNLTRIDLDYEGDDLNTNMGVRMGAIKLLQDNARAAGQALHVTLTVPMTTVGFPDTGKAELQAAVSAGVQFDLVNIMAFDYGLTNAATMVASVQLVAEAAKNQLATIFGYTDATAWAHLGLQLMNGHTDQPSELFTQADFTALLSYARGKHVGWYSFWSLNRDRACDPSVPHAWADGACSSVAQQPYEFASIVAQYTG
jgi:hypothetical protein